MAYAVGIKFDETTEQTIIEIWRQLSDIGLMTLLPLEGYDPHISMTLSDELRVDPFIEEISQTLQTIPNVHVQFSSVSLFTNPEIVLYYGVTPTEALLRLQKTSSKIYQKFALELNPLYQPGNWVPHCSLAIRIDEDKLKRAIDIAKTMPLPLSASSIEYVVIEHDGQQAKILQSFPL